MIKKQTKHKINYLVNYIGKEYPILIYRHGKNADPIDSVFYKKLYPTLKDKFNVFMPYSPSGWEFIIKENNINQPIGKVFTDDIKLEYQYDGRIYSTGHSAGGDWDDIAQTEGITAFAPVAGSANNYQLVKAMAAKKIPVWAWHGQADKAEGNTYEMGWKTAIKWYKNEFKAPLKWNFPDGTEYPNIGHSAILDKAYDPKSGLAEWFLSIGKPTTVPEPQPEPQPQPTVKKVAVIKQYIEDDKYFILELEDGSIKKITL
jgi:hypothetical protein